MLWLIKCQPMRANRTRSVSHTISIREVLSGCLYAALIFATNVFRPLSQAPHKPPLFVVY